jgi:DNA-binding MarR family transcriptional regulator
MDKDVIRNETLPFMVLIDAGNAVQRALEIRLRPLGIGVSQQRALTYALLAEGALTPSVLGSLLLEDSASVSGLLNRMEDRGLVSRTHDRRDRRVVWVELTDEGRNVALEATRLAMCFAREFRQMGGPDADDKAHATLERVLEEGMNLAAINEVAREEALTRVWGETEVPAVNGAA